MRAKEIQKVLRIAVENEREAAKMLRATHKDPAEQARIRLHARDGALCPILMYGLPGVGKSATTKGIAIEFGYNPDKKLSKFGFRDYRGSIKDPSDIQGTCFPVPRIKDDPSQGGKTAWYPPEEMPGMNEDDEPEGIFFLDELLNAPPLVQNAELQLILDRQVGSYHLPDGWIMVAASNREGQGAFVHKLSSALANRFCQVDFEHNLDDWTDWAFMHAVAPEVIGFLQWKSELLHKWEPTRQEDGFPSPRSWDFTSRWIKTGLPDSELYPLIKGLVGDGAAAEFVSFKKLQNKLPNIADVLKGKFIPFPEGSDLKYALVTGLAMRAKSVGEMENCFQYSDRITSAGHGEFAVLMVKLLAAKDADTMVKAPSWKTWVAKNKGIFYDS